MKRIIVLAAVALLLPATAAPQALTSLSSVRVRYSTQKATVRPQGELKAQIDGDRSADRRSVPPRAHR